MLKITVFEIDHYFPTLEEGIHFVSPVNDDVPDDMEWAFQGKTGEGRESLVLLVNCEAQKAYITTKATELRSMASEGAPASKVDGYAQKVPRAERVAAGNGTAADIAIITKEAELRGEGETPEQLAQLQLQKANAMGMAVAIIDGLEDPAIKALESFTTQEELQAGIELFEQALILTKQQLMEALNG